jgi:hypothetical protein
MALAAALFAFPALADRGATYEVTITNITKGQTFTPLLVATHSGSVRLFRVSEPATAELETLAEGGDTAPLAAALETQGRSVGDVQTSPGLLAPGETAVVTVRAGGQHRYLSVAAMLIPTNDTFVALNRARLPFHGERVLDAPAYDAGTEANDQSCASIPGPRCGGVGYDPEPADGDEGHISISNGFHDLGDVDAAGNEILGPLDYDWRNPVARVTVRRTR